MPYKNAEDAKRCRLRRYAERMQDQAYRQKKADEARRWRQRHPDRVKVQKRRYTRKYLERSLARIIQWKTDDPERVRKAGRDYVRRLRLDVIAGYGGKCECCGESNFEFLTIDHINGGGAKHRLAERARNFYIRLRREKFPRGEYRLLCMNCNFAFGMYGSCPHSRELTLGEGMAC